MKFENHYITYVLSLLSGLEVANYMPKPCPLKNDCSRPWMLVTFFQVLHIQIRRYEHSVNFKCPAYCKGSYLEQVKEYLMWTIAWL